MASFDIGAKLRQERVGQGLAISDIARDTRIAPRFLEAIEADDFAHLPGLIFTRNFVRQYALSLKLDPDPLLAELPKQDEASVQLPAPPTRPRSSYHRDRAMHSALSSAIWLLIAGGAGLAAYMHFNPSRQARVAATPAAEEARTASTTSPQSTSVQAEAPSPTPEDTELLVAPAAQSLPVASDPPMPVKVLMTASEKAWVQVSADGKTTFSGTMQSNETREIDAAEQVKIVTGNAGALKILLNGKELDSLGPLGWVRSVKLTAEGPEFLSKAHPPVPPDPL